MCIYIYIYTYIHICYTERLSSFLSAATFCLRCLLNYLYIFRRFLHGTGISKHNSITGASSKITQVSVQHKTCYTTA